MEKYERQKICAICEAPIWNISEAYVSPRLPYSGIDYIHTSCLREKKSQLRNKHNL